MTGRSIVRITVWAGLPVPVHSVSLKHFHSSCKSCLMLSHYWSIFWHCCFRAQWGKVTSWPCLSPSVRPGGWDERPASRDFLCLKFGKCWNLLYLQTAEAPYGWCFDPQRFRGSQIWRGSLSMRFLRAPMKHTSWHTELVIMNCLTFSYTSVLAVFWWMDFLHTQGSPFSRQLK